MLKRDELKDVCRKLELDDSGRQKQELIDRLLGRDGDGIDQQTGAKRGAAMAKRKGRKAITGRAAQRRGLPARVGETKEQPPAKIAARGPCPSCPIQYSYSPRRPPELRFDPTGGPDQLPNLLAEATGRPFPRPKLAKSQRHFAIRSRGSSGHASVNGRASGFAVDPVSFASTNGSAPGDPSRCRAQRRRANTFWRS